MIWSKNLPKTYDAPVPLWGFAGHPLVYKNLLICLAGGKDSAVVAFVLVVCALLPIAHLA